MNHSNKPIQMLAYLAISAFVIEAIIMFLLSNAPPLPSGIELLIDSSLLVCALFPLLYWLSFRPLMQQIKERQKVADELSILNSGLDKQVAQRTSQLLKVNEELKHEIETRNKLEKNLKATQGQMILQEKMASIGQLAAGVAHEINNPIGFISSNLNTMNKYVCKFVEFINVQSAGMSFEELKQLNNKYKIDYICEDMKDLVTESSEGVDRVKEIILNLKSFSRSEKELQKDVDINECMRKSMSIVMNEIKYKADINTEFGELPLIACYSQQLSQVFMNLLVNAGHAIEDKGEINVKTWHNDDLIYLSVSDTGHGIQEDNMHKLFEPFFTTKKDGEGTGLGLSISYDIVKKHNGDLTVDSEVGKGTTFTVTIPVVQ